MRTDVKIGIAVGALVLIIGIVYFVFRPKAETQSPQQPQANTNQPVNQPDRSRAGGAGISVAATDTSSVTGVVDSGTARLGGGLEPVGSGAAGTAVGRMSPPPGGASPAGTYSGVAGGSGAVSGSSGIVYGSPYIPPYGASGVSTTASLATAGSRQRTYTVKPGDSFWSIAKAQYGDTKYMTLVQQANPGVNPNALRAGQTIQLPAAPVETARTTAGGLTPVGVGAGTTTADRGNMYVVKAGDSLWKIAESQMGNGAYYTLIANANPNVDPQNLPVGTKLAIPARPASAGPTTMPAVAGRGASASPGGSYRPGKPYFDR